MSGPTVFVTDMVRVKEGRKAADATVRIGAVTVRHVLLLRHNMSDWALGFPRRWETDGYVDLIGMDKSLRAQVLAAVLAAYQDHSGE